MAQDLKKELDNQQYPEVNQQTSLKIGLGVKLVIGTVVAVAVVAGIYVAISMAQ